MSRPERAEASTTASTTAGSKHLDVIAVGAHPDDVEIGCGGCLAQLVRQGYRVGIVDLTDGEPTPGSPGPDVRLAEAQAAARTLGAARRSASWLASLPRARQTGSRSKGSW